MRRVLGVLAGIVGGTIVVGGIAMLGIRLFQPSHGFDLSAPIETHERMMDELPLPALLMVVLAWSLGALAGGWVAAKVARDWRMGLVAGAFLMLATVTHLTSLPHPAWMWVAGIVLPLPLAWLGSHAAARARVEERPARA